MSGPSLDKFVGVGRHRADMAFRLLSFILQLHGRDLIAKDYDGKKNLEEVNTRANVDIRGYILCPCQ